MAVLTLIAFRHQSYTTIEGRRQYYRIKAGDRRLFLALERRAATLMLFNFSRQAVD